MSRREQQRETTLNEIKSLARQQMAAQGAASISLRAIAKEMGLTPAAIYRYFRNYDALITTLIAESYHAQADALQAADRTQPPHDPVARLWAVMLAYRQWALDHPADFQLLYGNPIPNYDAPDELTLPAAQRNFSVFVQILSDADRTGQLQPIPAYQPEHLPPIIAAHLTAMGARDYPQIPISLLYLATMGWAKMHGLILLELFHHTQPVIGDTAAFYALEVEVMMRQMGLHR
ncbi:MAG: TetR/AcrR family transcriptional regulator [Anaerolineae bacterium]|jgi:AcrR family transcriptional regulator|nr:TetR/AcrR family transcriptional regulator [Anaerolineae bacterium]